jgi:hypothetical protein
MAVNDGRSEPVPGRAGAVPFVMPGIPYSNDTGLGGSAGAQSPALGSAWNSDQAGGDLGVAPVNADPFKDGQAGPGLTMDVHQGDSGVPGQYPDSMPFTGQGLGGTGAGTGTVATPAHPNSKGTGAS